MTPAAGQMLADLAHPGRAVGFFCTAMWLGGGMLYFWIIALTFYRYTFFTLAPSDLAPVYVFRTRQARG